MKSLTEYVKENMQINERVFDLTFQITHNTIINSTNGKPIALYMKLVSGENSLYETAPDGGALFIPYKYDKGNTQNWSFIKISPKEKYDSKHITGLIKKISGKELESVDFGSTGFPHRGPAMDKESSKYTMTVLEFDSDKLKKQLGSLEGEFYVYAKSNALTGILAIDKAYCWDLLKRHTDDKIIK